MYTHDLTRRTLLSLVVGASVAGTAGCLGNDENDDGDDDVEEVELGDGDITLQFSGWGEGVERETVEDMLESYAENNSNVGVEYIHVPTDFDDRLRTQFGADEEPDVFYTEMGWVAGFEEVLVDLEGDLSDDLLDDMDADVLEAFSPREGLYYLPKDFQSLGMIYNEEIFANAGYEEFPNHWGEFRDALENIQDNGDVDYPLVDLNQWLIYPFMYSNGGQIMNEDATECVIASDENIEALEFLSEMRDDDLYGLNEEVGADTEFGHLGEEQAAMVVGGGWVITELKAQYPDYDDVVDVAAPPYPEGEERGGLVFGAGYSISANSENQSESLSLIEYLMGDGMMPWLETGIALSIRESHRNEVELYDEDDRYDTFFDLAEAPRLGSYEFGPKTEEIHNTLNPQIEGIFQGDVEPAEALQTVENEVNNEILE